MVKNWYDQLLTSQRQVSSESCRIAAIQGGNRSIFRVNSNILSCIPTNFRHTLLEAYLHNKTLSFKKYLN